MEKGFDVFGKAYGVMLRNDLHDINSVDYKFMQEMILLNEESYEYLYNNKPVYIDMRNHELYTFAQQFKGEDDYHTIRNILNYTSKMAEKYDIDFKDMKFGGTEKEILERKPDWCTDLSRLGVVLIACHNIPARIIHLVNPLKAYHGHVVLEAFYENKYGICDCVNGYCFYDIQPIDAYTIMKNKELLADYPIDYQNLYTKIAINEYDPLDCRNDYTISAPNQYYLNLIYADHQDKWIMNEDK